jgi:hypothetical protein
MSASIGVLRVKVLHNLLKHKYAANLALVEAPPFFTTFESFPWWEDERNFYDHFKFLVQFV